jgi:hypothetical protein
MDDVADIYEIINVVVDLIFALFPPKIIRHLQVERNPVLEVYLLISCGLLTAVCSVRRVVASNLDAEDITCTPIHTFLGYQQLTN